MPRAAPPPRPVGLSLGSRAPRIAAQRRKFAKRALWPECFIFNQHLQSWSHMMLAMCACRKLAPCKNWRARACAVLREANFRHILIARQHNLSFANCWSDYLLSGHKRAFAFRLLGAAAQDARKGHGKPQKKRQRPEARGESITVHCVRKRNGFVCS